MSNALFSALSSILARRGRPARRAAGEPTPFARPSARAIAEGLERRLFLAVTTLSNGAGDGTLSVTVDAYGSYGSAANPAGDAFYNPVGPVAAQGSTFESAVFFTGFTNYLTESTLGNPFPVLPGVPFTSTTSSSAVSSFTVNGFAFALTQTVLPPNAGTTVLNQQYVVTNNTGVLQSFQLIRHVDGDMFFVGGFGNDFGGVSADGRFVFEFDTASDPTQATAYFGITGSGDGTPGGFTVQPFPYRDNIRAANGIPPADAGQVVGDGDGDRLTDIGYDVTITLADVFTLAPGASATYVTQTVFSQGSPQSVLNPGVLQFSQPTYTVSETGGSLTVTITRTQGTVGIVSVDYALTDGTATAGLDYTTSTGTLILQDAQTTATFVVPILDDALAEGDETVNMALSNPTGGAVLGTVRTSTIIVADDERAVQFNPGTYDVREDLGTVTLTLERTGPTDGTVTVNYATVPGTATEFQDYVPQTGTATFADGVRTTTMAVPIVGDFLDEEGPETFTVTLSNVTNAGLGTQNIATVNIINVDRPPTVYDMSAYAPRGRIEALFLTFNDPMNAATATDPDNYNLFLRTETRFGGAPSRKELPIRALEYVPESRIVTLRPMSFMRPNQFYEVRIQTTTPSGVVSAANQMLDGNFDRVAGDDFIGYFARGTKVVYSDRNGDRVRLGADKGGVLEVFRGVDREARVVRLMGAVPNRSVVFGRLTPRERQTDYLTHIDTLMLNGAQNLLSDPPFKIDVPIP
jgi:hypothetical protein